MLLDAPKKLSYYHEIPFVAEKSALIAVVSDGEVVELASCISSGVAVRAVFTPGHHASCITWVMDDSLFTGDAYIPGLQTVTNLSGGNRQPAAESRRLIEDLAVGRTVYPGHRICPVKVSGCGGHSVSRASGWIDECHDKSSAVK